MRRISLLNLSNVNWEDHTGKHSLLYCADIYYCCQHNCGYCYAKKMFHWKNPWREAEPVENAMELAKKEVLKKESNGHPRSGGWLTPNSTPLPTGYPLGSCLYPERSCRRP